MKGPSLLGFIWIGWLIADFTIHSYGQSQLNHPAIRREVAVTFDDLPGVAMLQSQRCNPKAFVEMNRKLLQSITTYRIPAFGLVVESRLCERQREALPELLNLWLDSGLELGNHSFSHFDLNNTPLAVYKADTIRGETILNKPLQQRGLVYERKYEKS